MRNHTCGIICSKNEDYFINPEIQLMIKKQIKLLINKGYTRYISGMNLGGDLYCSECIIEMKALYNGLKMKSVFPYENQAAHWTEDQREKYYEIASKCDDELLLQYHYDEKCEKLHREYIAITSDIILAVMCGEEVYQLIKDISNISVAIIHIDPLTKMITKYTIGE